MNVTLRFKFRIEMNAKSAHFERPCQEMVPYESKTGELAPGNGDDEEDESEIERLRIEIIRLRKQIAKLYALLRVRQWAVEGC